MLLIWNEFYPSDYPNIIQNLKTQASLLYSKTADPLSLLYDMIESSFSGCNFVMDKTDLLAGQSNTTVLCFTESVVNNILRNAPRSYRRQ